MHFEGRPCNRGSNNLRNKLCSRVCARKELPRRHQGNERLRDGVQSLVDKKAKLLPFASIFILFSFQRLKTFLSTKNSYGLMESGHSDWRPLTIHSTPNCILLSLPLHLSAGLARFVIANGLLGMSGAFDSQWATAVKSLTLRA